MPNGSIYEHEVKAAHEAIGDLVVRSAGSMGDGDLVLVHKQSPAVLLEVKSTKKASFSTAQTKETQEQFRLYLDKARLGYRVAYAIRYKAKKGREPMLRYFPLHQQARRFLLWWTAGVGGHFIMRPEEGLTFEEFNRFEWRNGLFPS